MSPAVSMAMPALGCCNRLASASGWAAPAATADSSIVVASTARGRAGAAGSDRVEGGARRPADGAASRLYAGLVTAHRHGQAPGPSLTGPAGGQAQCALTHRHERQAAVVAQRARPLLCAEHLQAAGAATGLSCTRPAAAGMRQAGRGCRLPRVHGDAGTAGGAGAGAEQGPGLAWMPKNTADARLQASPTPGAAPLASSRRTPARAARQLAQVTGDTPRPLSPASSGTTSTVKVDRKEAREASVVSRPTDWAM